MRRQPGVATAVEIHVDRPRKKMNRSGNSTGDMDRPPAAAGAPGGAGASAASLKIPDDRALLDRIRAGGHDGEQAFRSLVDRHARYLFAVARSMTPGNEDAE